MEKSLDEVRAYIWEKIRAHQAAGTLVRSYNMALRFGGLAGTMAPSIGGQPLCLLGALGYNSFRTRVVTVPGDGKPLQEEVLIALEQGFEGWDSLFERFDKPQLLPYFNLGKEIAETLEREEASPMEGDHGGVAQHDA